MSPNQKIHIIYTNFTGSTYCLMYGCPCNTVDILKRVQFAL